MEPITSAEPLIAAVPGAEPLNPLVAPKPFAELGLSPKVMAAIEAAGYTIATPIQSAAIPVALTGRDVLGIAQTGTGKTAAFVLPMITRLESGRARARMPRSLILAPTRELAAQVEQSFDKYGINHKLTVALLIGGTSMDEQVKKLDRGVDVLIATPGRMLDLYNRGRLMLMGVEILVIDEADRMLDMGFIPDIEKICTLLPTKKQTLFFSATMPVEITRLVNTFLNDPLRIEVARPATTANTIVQQFRFCPDGEDYAKREVLRELIRTEGDNVKNAIIFCNRKRDVAILLKSLTKHGYNAGALHGDMDQKARTETLDAFRAGKITFLAASDVAARGLDIPEVSHVFNFDVPWAGDDYVHRIGRTGRAGRAGTSLTLVAPDDLKLLKDIEKATAEQPTWIGTAPTPEDFSDGAKKRRRGKGGKPPERGSDRGAERGADRGRSGGRSARPADRAGGAAGGERPRRDAGRPAGRSSGPEETVERRPARRAREPFADVGAAGGAPETQVGDLGANATRPDRPERGRARSPDQNGRPPRQRREQVAQPARDQPRDQPSRDQQAPRDPNGNAGGERRPPRRQQPRSAPVGTPGDQPDVAGWPSLTPDGPVGDGAVPRRVPPRDQKRDGGRDSGRDGGGEARSNEPRARRETAPREPRADDARADGPRADGPRAAPRRDGDRRPHRDQTDGPPTGFSDNVPAFLRKPTKSKSD